MSTDHTLSRTRARTRALRLPRPPLRLLLALVALVALGGAGWMWLRDSSLVRVTDVLVTGTSSSAEPRIRAALDSAAREMTTLHVRERTLQQAVAGFPSVAALRIRTDFPHGLAVEVIERRPAAVLTVGDERLSVTGSGLLLRDLAAPAGLPEIALDGSLAGPRVAEPRVLAALTVAAATPAALRPRTARIVYGPRGITAELTDGPPLIFGTADAAGAKWAGAARVLADPSAAGATYLDLRATGRVAAGGIGPAVTQSSITPASPTGTSTPATAIPTVTAEPSPDPQPQPQP
ncbi:MAG: cell division protein FtsQ [Solirubrobacteraceae bacterium]|jgi:cell division protein FtsQ|nr:cell division protein FtsQ [Solirubrobacteraceae bacterium]